MTDSGGTTGRQPNTPSVGPQSSLGQTHERSSDLLSAAIFEEFDQLKGLPNSPQTYKSLSFADAKQSLISSLDIWIGRLAGYSANLANVGQKDRLTEFQYLFSAIGIVIGRILIEKNFLFHILTRSDNLKRALTQARTAARDVAAFFEEYAIDPKAYRKSRSQDSIAEVASHLRNLKDHAEAL